MKKGIRYWTDKIKSIPLPKLKLHDAAVPTQFIGRTILAKPELDAPYEEIKIESVQGALGAGAEILKKYFVINGTHFVSMLSFYFQLEEGRLPTDEEEEWLDLITPESPDHIKEIKDG